MQFNKTYLKEIGASIEFSVFAPEGKTAECHAMLHVEPRGEAFLGQYRRIRQAEAYLLGLEEMKGAKPVFKRYFLSDATNQQPDMEQDDSCTVS